MAVLMEEPVAVDELNSDSACALIELHPSTPERFVSN